MSDGHRHERGLLDTSVFIDLDGIDTRELPVEACISALSLAELAASPHATNDTDERALRQLRLQVVESQVETLPFDSATARAFGRVYAALADTGRKVRGRRSLDLLIAATALAANLPLYTRNPDDFVGLQDLIEIVPV